MARGGRKARFQQSGTTHSGAGEKVTLNMNLVGTNFALKRKSRVKTYKTNPKKKIVYLCGGLGRKTKQFVYKREQFVKKPWRYKTNYK